jgi:hypothetical protein
MKIKPLFFFALTFCLLTAFSWAGTTTLTGTINDASGNGISGTLYMALPAPAQDPTTGVAISPMWVAYRLVNGAITGSAKLYDVATINPSGLYYMARAYDQTGSLVFSGNYVVTSASFNLGAAVPTSVTTSNISYLNPASQNGNNAFTGLNSHSGLETFTGGINNQATPGFVAGIFNNGSGFKHARVTACTGAATSCNTSFTWTTAFADTNYTAACTYVSSAQTAWVANLGSKSTTGFSVGLVANVNITGAGEVDCIAVHD